MSERQQRVMFHDVTDCSDFLDPSIIAGVLDYGPRIFGASRPGDFVIGPESCKPHLPFILDHYRQVGLEVGEMVWAKDCSPFRDFPHHEPDVFFYGSRAHDIVGDQDWYKVVERMNNKNFAVGEIFKRFNIPTPKTRCFNNKEEFELNGVTYPIVFKPATGASGVGIKVCYNQAQLLQEVEKADFNFQLQEYKEGMSFLNIQFRILGGKLEPYIASEQVLEGNAHMGNRFPIDPFIMGSVGKQILFDAYNAANWMHSQGMKGYFAFDVMVTANETEGIRYFFLECNPRYNGASYPSVIAERLGAKSWVSKFIKTSADNYSGFDLGELAYNQKTQQGIVIINWGAINGKKIGVMFVAPTIEQQAKLETAFCEHAC